MAAWIAPAIMAASSIYSAMLANSGARQANATAQLNYQNDQQATALQQWYAQQAQRMSQAGQETATGSRTYFDPATNTWKTELSPMDQQLSDAEQQAMMQRLGPDERRRAQGQEQAYRRSLESDSLARAILGEIQDPQRITADQIYGDQLVSNHTNYNTAMDDILGAVVRGSLATGQGSNAGDITAKAMRERRSQLPSLQPSMLQARLQAMSQNAALKGDATNRYTSVASSAGQRDQGLPGTGLSSGLAALLQGGRSGAAGAYTNAMQGTRAPEFGGFKPNNDAALRVGGIGQSLAGAYDWYDTESRRQDRQVGNRNYSAVAGAGGF